MKRLLLAVAALFASISHAGDLYLQIHTVSHHFSPRAEGKEWNEQNEGMALRYQFNADWGVQAGFYDNSVNRKTRYAILQWTPFHVEGWDFGAHVGLHDGYGTKMDTVKGSTRWYSYSTFEERPTSHIDPNFGLLARYSWNRVSATVRYLPKYGQRSPSAVTTLELGYKF